MQMNRKQKRDSKLERDFHRSQPKRKRKPNEMEKRLQESTNKRAQIAAGSTPDVAGFLARVHSGSSRLP